MCWDYTFGYKINVKKAAPILIQARLLGENRMTSNRESGMDYTVHVSLLQYRSPIPSSVHSYEVGAEKFSIILRY